MEGQTLTGFVTPASDYRRDAQPIGIGRFGTVFLATRLSDSTRVAVRVILDPKRSDKQFMSELEVFARVRSHPCICFYYGADPCTKTIYMELLPNKSLTQLLASVRQGRCRDVWTGTFRAKVIFGFAVAMMHLHGYKVIHRYLRPSNIMFDENWEMRLCDFGFARFFGDELSEVRSDTYTAPEARQSTKYGLEMDVYSYGIIVYQIACLLQEKDFQSTSRGATELPPFPESLSPFLKKLITDCCDPEPKKRPTFREIVRRFITSDDVLFDDVNKDQFYDYCDKVKRQVFIPPADRPWFSELRLNSRDVNEFNNAKNEAEHSVDGCLRLAGMYERGTGTIKSRKDAFNMYMKAAEMGSATGMYNVGRCYADGIGVKRNAEEATTWAKRAAEGGVQRANILLGLLYEKSKTDGLKAQALELFKKMAAPPHNLGDAMFYAGRMLAKAGDLRQAMVYYEMAQMKGDNRAVQDLAVMYLQKGPLMDIKKGIMLLEKAAERSFWAADYQLGLIYLGRSVPGVGENLEKARYHLSKAASEGSPVAMLKLSTLNLTRLAEGVSEAKKAELEKEAVRLLELALRSKDADAQTKRTAYNNLGKLLLQGRGTPRDPIRALELLRRSCRKGNIQGYEIIAEVFEKGDEEFGIPVHKEGAAIIREMGKKASKNIH